MRRNRGFQSLKLSVTLGQEDPMNYGGNMKRLDGGGARHAMARIRVAGRQGRIGRNGPPIRCCCSPLNRSSDCTGDARTS